MNNSGVVGLLLLAGITVIGVANALFTVGEREQALVFQFGEFIREEREAGLKVKLPFVQDVVKLDKWILDLDIPDIEATSRDQRRLVVDAFVRYKISEPRSFFRAFRTEATAANRLRSITDSSLRSVVGQQCFLVIIRGEDVNFEQQEETPELIEAAESALESAEQEEQGVRECRADAISRRARGREPVTRAELMRRVLDEINRQASAGQFGLEIIDFRIRRADLPEQNSQAIFSRMEQERRQEAALVRARGERARVEVQSAADRQARITEAEGSRDASIIRAQGDGCSNLIYATAYGADSDHADFFAFYDAMRVYEETFRNEDTSFVMSPNNEFFSFFGAPQGRGDTFGGGSSRTQGPALSEPVDISTLGGPCAAFTDVLTGGASE